MKMKKFISLLVILCVAVTMLTACGKISEKRTLSVSFPKTAHATYQGTETITNYSHDRNKRIYDINQEDILCKQKETCGYYPYC